MSSSTPFDPYHKWLGIPPSEQPPNHYRLLGVALYESDPDVIETASEQRMTVIRARQAGPNAAASQQLLNEISAATNELLVPEKKRNYDESLRRKLSVNTPPRAKVRAKAVVPQAESRDKVTAKAPASEPVLTVTAPVKHGARRSALPLYLAGGAVALAVAFGAIAVYLLTRPGDIEPQVAKAPSDSKKTAPTKRIDSPPPLPEAPTTLAAQPAGAAETPVITPEKPVKEPAVPQKPANNSVANDVSAPPQSPDPPASAAIPNGQLTAPLPGRAPIPQEAELVQARQVVKELYGKEFSTAKSPQELSELATRLLQVGRETMEPPQRFALLDTARKMAEMAGDLRLVSEACDEIGLKFESDPIVLKVAAVDAVRKSPPKPVDWSSLATNSLEIAEEAIAADDYVAAARVSDGVQEFARKSRDRDLISQSTALAKRIGVLKDEFAKVQEAFKKVTADIADPDANLAVGRFLCFSKEDWDAGLRHLAAGSDEKLQKLAQADIDATLTPASWITVGDSWLAYQKSAEEAEKAAIERRIVYWYKLALPELAGLNRQRVELALKEISGDEESVAPVAKRKTKTEPKAANPLLRIIGNWKITYSGGAVRNYQFDGRGNARFVELNQPGKLRIQGNDILLDFGDGKVERLRLVDGTLTIDHFDPATRYPDTPTLTGRGVPKQ